MAYARLNRADAARAAPRDRGAVETLGQRRLDEVADQLGHHYRKPATHARRPPHLVRFAELATHEAATRFEDGCRAF